MPADETNIENIQEKLRMKKQSFYVWFLGAQECRGLRDEHFVRPVLTYLLDREKEIEPTKVTLQVSFAEHFRNIWSAIARYGSLGMHKWLRQRDIPDEGFSGKRATKLDETQIVSHNAYIRYYMALNFIIYCGNFIW